MEGAAKEATKLGLAEIADLIGSKCLAFICAATPAEIADRLDGKFLERQKEASLRAVQATLNSPVVTVAVDLETRRMAAASVLSMWNDRAEASVANILRRGGRRGAPLGR